MAELTERRKVAHLLRRAGFGGTPDEIDTYQRLGYDAAIDQLIEYERVANDAVEARVAEMEAALNQDRPPLVGYQNIWLYRMFNSARPLEEKMTLFWHNHFATANSKVANPAAMYRQNQLFRTNALGNFRTLLYAVSRDPAMLRWLDSNSNRRASPNENYARELMELFTMGRDRYTETDVHESARAFTGWFFDPRRSEFVFNANQHDSGNKTFLGRTGNLDGDDIVNIILEQSVTAEFMAEKMFKFFVHDHPSPSTISGLADTFRGTDYNVRELVRAIFRSPDFTSADAYHGVVKSPVEFVLGMMKSLGIAEIARVLPGALNRMGMNLFNPPDVSGWEWGADWIGSATLLERMNTVNALTTQRGDNAQFGMNPTRLLQKLGGGTAEQIVDRMLELMVDSDVPSTVRNGLVTYMNTGYSGRPEDFARDATRVDRTLRGLAHLITATPVYQMA